MHLKLQGTQTIYEEGLESGHDIVFLDIQVLHEIHPNCTS